MSAHCDCSEEEREPIEKEISPSHFEGESWVVECGNCWGLIRA